MQTLLDLIRQPLLIGAFVLSMLIVVGAYISSHWYYGEVEPVPEELLNYTPEPAVARGAPEGDRHGPMTRQGGAYRLAVMMRCKLAMSWTN